MDKKTFLETIETELAISKNSVYTLRNYLDANNKLLEFTKKDPEEINVEDVKKFLINRMQDAKASSTILFLAAIKFAYLLVFHKDITVSIKRPKKEKNLPQVLSKREVKLLLNSIPNQKSKLMLSLIYACGLRVSELTNLKIKDLNFEEKIGKINQAKGKKDRIFNIPSFLEEDLQDQVKKQRKFEKEFLFTGPKGQLSTRNIQKIVRKAAQKSGLPSEVHTHTLRHSFATHLLENDVDIRKIQELLGHSSISTTEIYTHISTQELKKIKSPIDSL
jgi:integrase/recombinase XerD